MDGISKEIKRLRDLDMLRSGLMDVMFEVAGEAYPPGAKVTLKACGNYAIRGTVLRVERDGEMVIVVVETPYTAVYKAPLQALIYEAVS